MGKRVASAQQNLGVTYIMKIPYKRLAFIGLCFVAAEYVAPAKAESIRETQHFDKFSLSINVIDAEDINRVCHAEMEKVGNPLDKHNQVKGCSLLTRNKETQTLTCKIWIPTPDHVDDDNITSVGHEVWHCARGDYHE